MLTLKKFTVYNFRSIQKLKFNISPLSIFIGRNNSGKTNILKACELLKYSSTPEEMAKQAKPNKCAIVENDQQLFAFTFEVAKQFGGSEFSQEELKKIFIEFPEITIIFPFQKESNFFDGNYSPIILTDIKVDDIPSFLSRIFSPIFLLNMPSEKKISLLNNNKNIDHPNLALHLFNEFYQKIPDIFFSSSYRASPEICYIDNTNELSKSGQNLQAFLFDKAVNNDIQFEQYVNVISQIFPEIINIKPRYKMLQGNTIVSLSIMERNPKSDAPPIELDFKDLGTGIEKILIIIAQVFFSKQGTIFLLDEPADFLHPTAQQNLMLFFHEQIKNDHKTFLTTSHSTAFINSPDHPFLAHVFKDETGTHIKAISEPIEIKDTLFDIDNDMKEKFQKRAEELGLNEISGE